MTGKSGSPIWDREDYISEVPFLDCGLVSRFDPMEINVRRDGTADQPLRTMRRLGNTTVFFHMDTPSAG